jgi:hypothetical protein
MAVSILTDVIQGYFGFKKGTKDKGQGTFAARPLSLAPKQGCASISRYYRHLSVKGWA